MKKKLLIKIIACSVLFFTSYFTNAQIASCFQQIKQGSYIGVGLKANGELWFWGDNSLGQFGNGTTSTVGVYDTTPVLVSTNDNWREIFISSESSYGIKNDGTLWAWGENSKGQLGDGTTIRRTVPTQIGTDTNWLSISELQTGRHVLGLKTNGTLWAWGQKDPMLGLGPVDPLAYPYILVPTQVGSDTNWSKIATNFNSSYAIKTNGTLWAWGNNTGGNLGLGNYTNYNVPTQIGVETNWETIISGYSHMFATKTNGQVWGWGFGTPLGIGTIPNNLSPVLVSNATIWKTISGGNAFSAGIKNDGTLWVWGANPFGYLGNGNMTNQLVPVQIGTDTNWDKISTAYFSTQATKTDGSIWAWGNNQSGQLGDGTTISKLIPTQISCPASLATTDFLDATNTISIYPNPAKEILNVNSTNPIVAIVVYNSFGQEVKSMIGNQSQIDLSTIPKGIYVVKIITNDNQKTVKIIKE
jgi:alpha-tubulin suppressor-like RCC1 family protein